MRRWPLLVLALVSLSFAPAPPPRPRPDPSAADLKKMQGVWVLTDSKGGWWATCRLAVGQERIEVARDRLSARSGDSPRECVLTLDATKAPRQYAETSREGLGLGCRGIYSVEGDTLRFCCGDLGDGPPASFDSPKRGSFLAVYKRAKP